ncbi:hypothetical protein VTJ83DRAFT_3589 [Remersonia thermophila]|uniref:Heterokaryon incompatibility domain-containing protein n=1 Tax=Remersonia thermophila TaxID=72144 RepID=A0ABR4DEF0_9PEZI
MERARYLTLSYRWGDGNDPSRTTALNLKQRTRAIHLADLPRTIQDAILVTRSLRMRYIWIDAVCIIQSSENDPGDFDIEGRKMAAYYSNSYCTIAATSADDAAEGFLRPRGAEEHETTLIKGFPVPEISWVGDIIAASMHSRGWVLQERALSRRTLHWGREQLWWECEHQRACEMFPQGRITGLSEFDQPYMKARGWLAGMTSETDLWPTWASLAEAYNGMDLAREADRLIALQGLADVVLQRFPSEKYFFGLWGSTLQQQLCWKVDGYYQLTSPAAGPPTPCPAPSWSWASCLHLISYQTDECTHLPQHALARFLGHEMDPSDPNACALRFQGNLQRAPFTKWKRWGNSTQVDRDATDEYRYTVWLDDPPDDDNSPGMARLDMLLMAGSYSEDTDEDEDEDEQKYDMRFLVITPVAGEASRYRRVGLATCWAPNRHWRPSDAVDAEVCLI